MVIVMGIAVRKLLFRNRFRVDQRAMVESLHYPSAFAADNASDIIIVFLNSVFSGLIGSSATLESLLFLFATCFLSFVILLVETFIAVERVLLVLFFLDAVAALVDSCFTAITNVN